MEDIVEKEIHIRDYINILLKRKWTVITVFTVIALTAFIRTITATPIYKSTSRIVIEKDNPNVVSIQEVMAVDPSARDYLQTEIKIIKSRSVARSVIERLDLKNSEEFFPKVNESITSSIKLFFKSTLKSWKQVVFSLFRTDENAGKNDDEDSEITKADTRLVTSLVKRIEVTTVRDTRIVDISVFAKDPRIATRIANEVVKSYVDQKLEIKLKAAKNAVKWLSDRVEDERKKVADAEFKLLKYKDDQGIISGFSDEATQITAQKLAQLEVQVLESESARMEAETRYLQAVKLENSPDSLNSIPDVMKDEIINEIKKMEVSLYKRLSELSKKYGGNHPQMIAIRSELADLKKRSINQVKNVVQSLRNEYKLAVAREESLNKQLEKQKRLSLDLNKKAIQYSVLQRQAESSKHIYDLLIKRLKETSLTEEMKTGNIRVIDIAEVPLEPSKPDKKRSILLGIILGLAAGIGFAFFLEYFDNTIKYPDDVKNLLDIPYLGLVPRFDDIDIDGSPVNNELVVINSPKSTVSEAFRGIRTGILFSSVDAPPKTLLITSSGPAEGKTSCAANLAVTMAEAGSKVVIIDCDMRRPRVQKIFKTERETGVSTTLVGSTKLNDVIIHTDIKNLDIIPSGQIPPNPSEILGSKKMEMILDTLKKNYDRIIIDSSPIGAVTDSTIISKFVDGVILIIKASDTPRQIVQNGVTQLKNINAHILGAVLNNVEVGNGDYYYQYYYYYYGDEEKKDKTKFKRKARKLQDDKAEA